jgi:carboxymethylenebutenolidase
VNPLSHWIDIPANDGGRFEGYLALPPAGKGPGLLILQEIFGVNAHIRGVAEQYAAQGYVVLAPDLFWRFKPHMEIPYHGESRVYANQLYDQLDKDLALADVAAAAARLRALPEATGKVAAVGFCLGGWLTYAAAAAQVIDVGVSYYGGGIQHALDLAERIVAPMQFHFGESDPHVPIAVAEKLREAFMGRDAEVHTYPGADHGFNCWERETYDSGSAAVAHERALRFLDAHQ